MKNSAIKWLYKVTGKHKISIAILLVIQSFLGISSVVFAMILRNVIDFAANQNKTEFFTYLMVLIVLVAVQISLRAVVRYLEELSRSSIENNFKDRLFSNLLTKDYASVTATHSGEWLNRLTNDTVVCANGVVEILPDVSGMIVKMIGALVMILALEPRFAYILFPGGAVLIFLTYAFRKVLKKLHKNVQEKDGKLRVFLQERLGSLLIVRSFAAENQTEIDAKEKMSDHKTARMRKNRFSNICNVGFSVAMNGMYLLGLGYCGYGILLGNISYGTLTAILQLISQIQSPFANITGYLPKFYAMTASAERLIEVENFTDDCPNGAICEKEIHRFYANDFSAISFENAVFSYRNAENLTVMQNVSLKINKGEYVAFTGHSGCGKSTFLKLLMCLYPLDSGKRYLCKSDGSSENLKSEWHRLFAYVPQGNQLMSGTIREVIAFADKKKMQDNEKLKRALKIACADEFVDELESGIDTVLGERGQGLSEGQMQRIAVARAIFSDNPILLLDESTSALDEQTEKNLLENLRNMTNKTVLIVTHRPAALNICDKIIRMTEKGIEVVK
jgi:ATP-binding cassette subfamily B protein